MSKVAPLKIIIASVVSLSLPVCLLADNLLLNGDFEETVEVSSDADKQRYQAEGWRFGNEPLRLPLGWALHDAHPGRLTLVEEDAKSGNIACKVEDGGWIHAPFPVNSESTVNITFWAKGEGKVGVMIFQYEHDSSGAVIQFLETVQLETIHLDGEWKEYKMQHHFSVPAVNRAHIAFDIQGVAILDAVSIEEQGAE